MKSGSDDTDICYNSMHITNERVFGVKNPGNVEGNNQLIQYKI